MKKTIFAGLTVLEPGDGLDTDSGAFADLDRETIDRLLRIGAKTHRHDGSSGLINPSAPPGASVVASAGTLPAGSNISIGYTLEDPSGGETMLSPVATVSTRGAVEPPQAAPSAVADYTGGSLLVNTYFYARTFTDGEGGETQLGPSVSVERAPGFASGRVQLSALAFGMAGAGGKGWRLYRAIGGGSYCLLATGTADSFTDDGSVAAQCDVHPPAGEENTTVGVSTLIVTLPSGGLQGAPFINLYVSTTGDFNGGSFIGQYPLASAGKTVVFPTLEPTDTGPPPVNLSIGGAPLIDTGLVVANAQTSNYILELLDSGKCVSIESVPNAALVVPLNATIPFPVGTEIEVCRMGSGAVVVAGSASVMVNSPGGKLNLAKRYSMGRLRKVATDSWVLNGDLALTKYEEQVLADEPALYWRLGSGGLVDRCAGANNGIAHGAPGIGSVAGALPGDPDAAMSFNGSSQYVASPYAWVAGPAYTLEAWVNRADTKANHPIISGDGATPPFLWLATGGEDVVWQAKNGAGSETVWPGAWPGTGQWVHVVLVFNPTEKKATLYINGALVSTKEHVNAFAGAGHFQIGSMSPASSVFFNGSLDEIALYAHELGAAWVKAHYEARI